MIVLLVLRPGSGAQAARQALGIWGLDVVPSLFPYMVLCRLLSERLRRARLPAAPAAAVLGLMGGSPAGASVLAAYAGNLPDSVLLPLCALTGTISPMFFLGTMDAWLSDRLLCRMLLASHWAGAGCAAAAVYLLTRRRGDKPMRPTQDAGPGDAIAQSVQAILSVGGCIVFFSVAAEMIRSLPLVGDLFGALMHAGLEAAGGMHALCAVPCAAHTRAMLMAAAGGFTGLSILTQNLVFLRPLGVSLPVLTGIAVLRALFAALAMALMLAFC
ncbi:MAG: hypothetical protein ACI4PG_07555 [Candidatus Ventricola sp.]